MKFIEIQHLSHVFKQEYEEGKKSLEYVALDDINLSIDRGEFVAIIGVNGSGKSTLAKHLNGLLLPTEGKCLIDGVPVAEDDNIWEIRRKVSMVFQNPDNQIIAAIVEDDIAFGPENMGIDPAEIRERIDFALDTLHIRHLKDLAPHLLSGGQKQLTAIAGALAMRTKCIVLDEPTAMLDPQGRKAVMAALKELHEKYKLTIIIITHFMEEAVEADRIVVMHQGKVVQDGKPTDIFANRDKLRKLGLEVPLAIDIADDLRAKGVSLTGQVENSKDLAIAIKKVLAKQAGER